MTNNQRSCFAAKWSNVVTGSDRCWCAWMEKRSECLKSLVRRVGQRKQSHWHRETKFNKRVSVECYKCNFLTVQSHSEKSWFWVARPRKKESVHFFLGLWGNRDIFLFLVSCCVRWCFQLSRNTTQVTAKQRGSWIWNMIPCTDAFLDLPQGGNKACGISTVVTLRNYPTATAATTTTGFLKRVKKKSDGVGGQSLTSVWINKHRGASSTSAAEEWRRRKEEKEDKRGKDGRFIF